MKIAFDSQIFTNQLVGGVSRYYCELAKNLNHIGEDISIFAGLYQNEYLGGLEGININGRKIKYPNKSIRLFQTINSFISNKQIKEFKPDIVHSTYYSNNIFPNHDRAQVITVFDMIHELFKEDFSRRHLITEKKRKSLERANHIICISNSTKIDLINIFGIDESKISVIHLGVNVNEFSASENIKKNSFKPFLLYVGHRKGYKNFNNFIEAFATSKYLSMGFDIVAFGGGYFDKYELNFFQKLKLKENQIRQVQGDDFVLRELYANASAFVYPSLYEGFGLPPLEAMASGCPVISSNTSSMPEVIGSAGEYFEPNNIESIRFAIENVLINNSYREKLILKGYENVTNFSWNKCANETLNVYKNI